jgi:hypothetical protein
VFSRELMLVQHTLDSTGNVAKSTEAKLAGRELTGACWVGESILAIGTNQNTVRMWDLTENEPVKLLFCIPSIIAVA